LKNELKTLNPNPPPTCVVSPRSSSVTEPDPDSSITPASRSSTSLGARLTCGGETGRGVDVWASPVDGRRTHRWGWRRKPGWRASNLGHGPGSADSRSHDLARRLPLSHEACPLSWVGHGPGSAGSTPLARPGQETRCSGAAGVAACRPYGQPGGGAPHLVQQQPPAVLGLRVRVSETLNPSTLEFEPAPRPAAATSRAAAPAPAAPPRTQTQSRPRPQRRRARRRRGRGRTGATRACQGPGDGCRVRCRGSG
jgi:hypothetical protein